MNSVESIILSTYPSTTEIEFSMSVKTSHFSSTMEGSHNTVMRLSTNFGKQYVMVLWL